MLFWLISQTKIFSFIGLRNQFKKIRQRPRIPFNYSISVVIKQAFCLAGLFFDSVYLYTKVRKKDYDATFFR